MSINVSTNPVDIIETTQKLRLQMVNKLTGDGERIPTESKEVGTLSMLLRDMDAAALTTRKLDVEEKGVDAASIASANVAAVLKELGGNPFKARVGVSIENHSVVSVIPAPDASQLPTVILVPGVTKIGEDKLEYAEFVVDDSSR